MKNNFKNPALVWLSSLNSKVSIKNYTSILNRLCRTMDNKTLHTFDWAQLNYVYILKLKRKLLDENVSHQSINTYLSIIKSVARESWRLSIFDIDTYMKIKDIQRLKGNSDISGRALEPSEINKLISVQVRNGDILELRDIAITAVTYGAGLRRGEISALKPSDKNGNRLVIHGKGSKTRYVYLPTFTLKILNKWLAVINDDCVAMFPPIRRGGNVIFDKHLSPCSVREILKRRQELLGLEHFSPHDLRRSFATNLLANGADIYTVNKLMRHGRIETTMLYDMQKERGMIEAIELLPY